MTDRTDESKGPKPEDNNQGQMSAESSSGMLQEGEQNVPQAGASGSSDSVLQRVHVRGDYSEKEYQVLMEVAKKELAKERDQAGVALTERTGYTNYEEFIKAMNSLPAAQFNQPQAGLNESLLPPILDDEPEAKGWTSSRQWVAAPSAVLTAQRLLTVEFPKAPWPKSYEGVAPKEWLTTFDVVGLLKHEQFRARYDARSGLLDMRNVVFGVTKGVLRSVRSVGLVLSRASETIKVLDGVDLEEPVSLVVEPAYAAAFVETVDESTIKARRVMAGVFPDATNMLTDVAPVCRHIREMLDGNAEVTRYTARLAAIVVETALIDAAGGNRFRWDAEVPAMTKYCGTWASFRLAVLDDAGYKTEHNYVPWEAIKGMVLQQEKDYARVLRLACADKVYFQVGDERRSPTVWPRIDNVTFYCSVPFSAEEADNCGLSLSVNDAWVAARLWCHRYGDVKKLEQLIQLYLTTYWKADGRPGRLAFSSSRLGLRMPKARMRGFVCSPYLKENDNMIKMLASAGPSGIMDAICETTMLAMLIGFAGDWCRWVLMDYALVNELPKPDEVRMMTTLIRGSEESGSFWPIVQGWLNGLGYTGSIGKYLGTMISRQSNANVVGDSLKLVTQRMNSSDMLGWFGKIPHGCAAQGLIAPCSFPSELAISGNTTMFSAFPKDKGRTMIATLFETSAVEYITCTADRDLPSLRSAVFSPVMLSERGYPQDNPMMALTNRTGDRVRFGFRLPHSAAFGIGDSTHDRFNLKWYVASRKIGNMDYRPIPGVLNPVSADELSNMGVVSRKLLDLNDEEDYTSSEEDSDGEASISSGEEQDPEPEEEVEIQPPNPLSTELSARAKKRRAQRLKKQKEQDARTVQYTLDATEKEKKRKEEAAKRGGLKGGARSVDPNTVVTTTPVTCNIAEAAKRDAHDREDDDAAAMALLTGNDPALILRSEFSDVWERGDELIDEGLRSQMLEMVQTHVGPEEAWRWAVGVCQSRPQMNVVAEKQLLQWMDAVLTSMDCSVPSTDSALLGEELAADILKQDALNMLNRAEEALKFYAWKVDKHDTESVRVLQLAREIGNPNPCGLSIHAVEVAAGVINPDMSARKRMQIACEFGAMQMEFKAAIEQQLQASGQAHRLGLAVHDTPAVLACACLFEVKNDLHHGVGRCHAEQVRGWRAGACPKTLVSRFGGAWRGKKGLVRQRDLGSVDCTDMAISGSRMWTWFLSLKPKQKAQYLLEIHPAVIGPEHFQLLGAKCAPVPASTTIQTADGECPSIKARAAIVGQDWGADRKFMRLGALIDDIYGDRASRLSDMERRKPKGGFPYTITAGMVSQACPGLSPLIELLHNNSPESDESEVAGTALALACLPVAVMIEVIANRWLEAPLAKWYQLLKMPLTDIRRSLTFGEVRGESLLKMRKLLNVTIRQTGDSDVGLENYNRSALVTRKHWYGHWAPDSNGNSAFTAYEKRFAHHAREVIRLCLLAMPYDTRAKSLKEFWSERALRGAAGASKAIKKVSIDIPELCGADRPGKKMLTEYLDEHALLRTLRSVPTNRAYYFVKPEPGLKLRSLFAAYDEEAFVSSYANQAVENYMGAERGIMVRQTPADVIEWMAVSKGGIAGPEGEGAYWLSTDYSDYNSEHTQWEMLMLDVTFGLLLCDGSVGCYNYEKAYAHFWTAAGRMKTVVIYGQPQKFRGLPGVLWDDVIGGFAPMLNGLYSGSRTTARDNTWIHAVDLRIGKEMLNQMLGTNSMRWAALCGDDEDVAFDNELAAAMYYATLAPMGHNLNPVKQLAGRFNHEFLQLTTAISERVEKPLNSLLATLSTGNWYVQSGVWLQTTINGVVNNYWECFCRGMPLQVARRLAAATLDAAMHVKVDLNGGHDREETNVVRKDMEWWKYRHNSSLPPLFRYTEGDEVLMPPQYEAVAKPTPAWPKNASVQYAEQHGKLLRKLPPRIKGEFISHMQASTVGATLKVWQQRKAKEWCARHWPARQVDGCEALKANPDHEDWEVATADNIKLEEYRYGIPKKQAMLTEEAVCGRMGVPFFLARKLGGIDKLGPHVSLEQWSRYTDVSTTFYPLSGEGHRLQMNLRAASSWATAPIDGIHGNKLRKKWEKMAYVFMGNGAGKSHFNRIHPDAQDIDTVWMDAYGSMRERYSHAAAKSHFSVLPSTMAEILMIAAKRGPVLMGHVSPREMVEAARRNGISLELFSYDPGVEVRKDRLRARGWSEAMVERRISRSKVGYDDARELGARELKSYTDLELAYQVASGIRVAAEVGLIGQAKQPAKYVFDRTEAVTRKLEIEQLRLRQLPVQ